MPTQTKATKTTKASKPRKPKASRSEGETILAAVETALVRRVSERQILRLLLREYQVGRRQAYRYIAAVRARWSDEAKAESREDRRNHMRKTLEDAYGRALATTKTKPDPDVSSALRASKLLMELDALAAPTKATVELTGTMGVAAASVPARTRASLEAWLRGEREQKA